ncbi:hypothetical protein FB45DRAFT_408270 [Roridomyces roridus]|uniref:C2 domain-containing protein n=1 Tax=Roridomyces roridus TaxID=1738132 RepID=A0AAD7C420_9AGAR|nr:hypothetical protein FB45DRAFT_408270 [Roridomyces roridus]
MSSPSREIGTLVVVILKANHLPNKRHIGKQDPYCSVSVNGEKQRTKVIKRGGQHPEWDEELRFTIYEDDGPNAQDGVPPPPPPKNGARNIKGGRVMKLSCFADDPREPDLIGETDVDLTEVLTKGETDEWFNLLNKDKFAGKVYLELTFWSNEPPPQENKITPQPTRPNNEYSGPGNFVSADDVPASSNPGFHSSRVPSTSHSRLPSDSSTLRSSHSLQDTYRPAYGQPQRARVASFSAVTDEFGGLSVGDPRRRETFPPPHSAIHNGRPPSSMGFSTYPPPHGYEPSVADTASMYGYERPLTPPGQTQDPSNFRPVPYTPQAPYRVPYDAGSVMYNPPPSRGPRYSSGFVSLSSHQSEPSGFPVSHTPAPLSYSPSHLNQPAPAPYAPPPPGPGYAPPLPPSSSTGFHQPGLPPSQSFPYSVPAQYNIPPPAHQAPPAHQGYPPSPSQAPAPSLSHSNSLSSSAGPGSRPLPQQPQYHTPPPDHQSYGLPPSSSQYGSTFQESYQPAPPPPPPLHVGRQSYSPNDQGPPPPPPLPSSASPRRRSSLPPPPTHLQQPYPTLPPPPPPPPPLEYEYQYSDYSPHNPPPLPSHPSQTIYYPGPPPRPPNQLDGQQWTQQPQTYASEGWN